MADDILSLAWLLAAIIAVLAGFVALATWAGGDSMLTKAQRDFQRRERLRGKWWV